jgi:hypothetical protein
MIVAYAQSVGFAALVTVTLGLSEDPPCAGAILTQFWPSPQFSSYTISLVQVKSAILFFYYKYFLILYFFCIFAYIINNVLK